MLRNALVLLAQDDFTAESLKVHPLHGRLKNYYAFSLTYGLRVVFQKKDNEILLVNIKLHLFVPGILVQASIYPLSCLPCYG